MAKIYQINEKTKKYIEDTIENKLGISYEEYEKLDFDEQQKLIREYHKKNTEKKSKYVIHIVGSGEHSIITRVKRGERIFIGGDHSCFVRAGITPEESRKELDDKLDEVIYSKPVAFVKKLQRKFK